MNMEASYGLRPSQIHVSLDRENLDCEIRLAENMCSDVKSIRGTVGILLALCKSNRKIDPSDLSGLLTILSETLDGTEDWAEGVCRFLRCLTPIQEPHGGDVHERTGMHLIS